MSNQEIAGRIMKLALNDDDINIDHIELWEEDFETTIIYHQSDATRVDLGYQKEQDRMEIIEIRHGKFGYHAINNVTKVIELFNMIN